jgi:DNA-binding transcriptional MerR regulator
VSGAGEVAPARPGPHPDLSPSKAAAAFRTIGEVAEDLDLPTHVLRFWESKFPQLKPLKRGGGRRYYRPEDIVLLRRIRQCLYQDGYTIRGVRQLLDSDAGPAPNGAATRPAHLPLFPLDNLPLVASEAAADRDSDPPVVPARPPRRPRRRPTSPDMRDALEEIRRELLEVRALLDGLLRRRAP